MWSNFATRIDDRILLALTSLVGRSASFDGAMQALSHASLANGVFVMAVFCWYWFRQAAPATAQRTREQLLGAMIAAVGGLFVARVMAQTLPFRLRPRFEPALHLAWPAAPDALGFVDWSAFPSDHAVMFSALAAGLCFVSWRTGLGLLLFTLFIVSLPRVYYGLHYPTDVFAGMALGALFAYGMNATPVNRRIAGRLLLFERRSPRVFQAALIVVAFEFATMFNGVRSVAREAFHLGGRLLASALAGLTGH
ncbi:MAG: phosphatase PAP2 family protein [Steroidobacteraceae bacterium]